MNRTFFSVGFVSLALLLASTARAQATVSLLGPREAWNFNNGAEFPGAKGGLTADDDQGREGRKSLKLVGDFTGGGGYVQAGRKIENVDIRELTLWLRTPTTTRFTLRLNDGSGQTHQIVFKTEAKEEWQEIRFPVEQFYAKRGQADAVPNIAKFESWGGAKDGNWHGPAKAMYLLLGNPGDKQVHTLWIGGVDVIPRATAVPGAETKSVVRLDEIVEGEHEWTFSNGPEFKGATGSLTVAKDEPKPGDSCLKLAGDFTAGGAYVAALRKLDGLEAKDMTALRLRYKTTDAVRLGGVQLVDGTGQTHQRKDFVLTADNAWHDLVIEPAKVAGGEHWGGANDGKWHGPPRMISLSLAPRSSEKTKQPVVYLADIRADVLVPVFVQPAAFQNDFEKLSLPADGWKLEGSVAVDDSAARSGKRALHLSRTLEKVNEPCSVTAPAFSAAPGRWRVTLQAKADLNSPDNSYSGVVELEAQDASGKVLEKFTVADAFGRKDWHEVVKLVELPAGTASARFRAQLNKTHGDFRLDDLSAAYLAPAARKDGRIARLLFDTGRLGNLLFPEDPRKVTVSVEALKPLRDEQLSLDWDLRDYWGAEQAPAAKATLVRKDSEKGRLIYEATLDLGNLPLEIGRYYEVHASLAQPGEEAFRNMTSLAILPEATTRQFKPEEVPFTARNWDNRIAEYIRLSDRLGVRICGLWGGWSSKAPYAAEAPNLELARSLGMGWLTTTPIAQIELGKRDYTEESLRQGVRNLIEKYGKERPLIINLGNEPHGKGQRVLDNVAAYKTVYEEVKKIDPTIPVVATSVEPNEEYFKAGYGKWCDAFDFHIYEEFPNVRRTIHEYRELAKKYDCEKPIWSTELGLNSQGMTRHTVAKELYKKVATFFAAGGANVSWFGILYPDPEGKSAGSSGDAHNVFDCRFKRYAPRLDAVAYYHAVNSVAIKKFVEEKQYAEGISAFLFRDRDGCMLQILWKDTGTQDVFVPLPGVEHVRVIRIDGSTRELQAARKGLTLSLNDDPLLLLYESKEAGLAQELGKPAARLAAASVSASRSKGVVVEVQTEEGALPVELKAPPQWTVARSSVEGAAHRVRFTLTPPKSSAIRQLDLIAPLGDAASRRGELYLRLPVGE